MMKIIGKGTYHVDSHIRWDEGSGFVYEKKSLIIEDMGNKFQSPWNPGAGEMARFYPIVVCVGCVAWELTPSPQTTACV